MGRTPPQSSRNARGSCRSRGGSTASRRTMLTLVGVFAGLFAFPFWYVTSRNGGPATPVQFSKINSNKRLIRAESGAHAGKRGLGESAAAAADEPKQ